MGFLYRDKITTIIMLIDMGFQNFTHKADPTYAAISESSSQILKQSQVTESTDSTSPPSNQKLHKYK